VEEEQGEEPEQASFPHIVCGKSVPLLKELTMFQRILVPLDGSRRAEQVLPLAARIARASGSTIVLMQASWMPPLASGALEPAFISPDLFARDRADIAVYLARLAVSEDLKDLPTQREVADGEPALAILRAAQRQQADLIIMSSHGRTGLPRALLGSVAERVAHESSIPVLIVRTGTAEVERGAHQPPLAERPIQVLVALDGSKQAETALSPAANLSVALSASLPGTLHLVRVLPQAQTDEMTPTQKEQASQQATAYLEQVSRRLRGTEEASSPLQVFSSVVLDAPDRADALVHLAQTAEAEEGAHTLIVLAPHERTGWQRLTAFSLTRRVLAATRLPVLIVHPPQSIHSRETRAAVPQEALL
jgi:nucleotide-binding universal stress UspA family protein